jgi:hypothetical protein
MSASREIASRFSQAASFPCQPSHVWNAIHSARIHAPAIKNVPERMAFAPDELQGK